MKHHGAVLAVLFAVICAHVESGNVLVWPAEASHWINLKPVLEALVDRGHSLSVLVPSVSLFMDTNEPSHLSFIGFNVTMSEPELEDFLQEYLRFEMYEAPTMNALQKHLKFYEFLAKKQDFMLDLCDGILKSPPVMEQLRSGGFQVLLADPVYFCAELLAQMLAVPFIYTFRFSPAHTMERLCAQTPAPPSYVPVAMSELTDQMSFKERVASLMFYLANDLLALRLWRRYDAYYSQHLGRPTSLCELMGKAEIWLIRTYWDFEYPKPLLPNFKFVGGIHCRPAKPLSQDFEEFVQSSGDDGIVVFSLGSMITNLTKEKSNMIASALGQIPQKVLWRYSGEKPDTLALNTRIYDWIPQNDLLGLYDHFLQQN